MKRNFLKLSLAGASIALLLSFLGSIPSRTAAEPAVASSNLFQIQWWGNPPTLLLAVGNSLTQGTKDAANNEINTRNGYLQLVYESLNKLDDLRIRFSQPFLNEYGRRINPYKIPTNLGVDGADIFSVEGLKYWKRVGGEEGVNELTNDYRCERFLPFMLKDNWDKVLYPINLWAGKPVSQTDALIWHLNNRRGPAWVIFWVGNNDAATASLGSGGENPQFLPIPYKQIRYNLKPILSWILGYGKMKGVLSFEPYTEGNIVRNLTDYGEFIEQYNHILERVYNEVDNLDEVKFFICTLPYYCEVGYLFDADDLEFYLGKLKPSYEVPDSFRANGGRVSLLTFGFMYALMKSGYPVFYVNQILEDDGLVLSESEREDIIKHRIDSFNEVIKSAVETFDGNFHLIDIGQELNRFLISKEPVEIGGVKFHSKWRIANGFTLDGVHGSHTAHALIANFFLKEMNSILGVSAPTYELPDILANDPYVDMDGDGWLRGPDYRASGLTKLLFLLRDLDYDTGSDLKGRAKIDEMRPDELWDLISDILLEEMLGFLLF